MKLFLKLGILLAIVLAAYVTKAQTSDYDNDLVKLMSINGSTETYNMMYDQILVQIKAGKSDVPDSIWSNLKTEVYDKSVNDLTKQMVPLYKKYFTQSDVKELISFYESPIGLKLITKTPLLTKEAMQFSQTWGMNLMSDMHTWIGAKGY